jgi:transcription antitermination protein NusB
MTPRQPTREPDAERRLAERPRRESRHGAREAAVQMLYQWEVGRLSMPEVMSTYWTFRDPQSTTRDPQSAVRESDADGDVRTADGGPRLADSEHLREFATALTNGVAANLERIDPLIAEAAEHWRIERMAVMDRIVLRLAVYEFLEQPETPGRVIINEALELARTFSTDDAVRFINGILDGIRRRLGRE